MARVCEGELLNPRRTIAAGALCLLAFALPGVTADGADPIFFRDPDAATSRRIQDALDLLKRTSISDHSRGREVLEEIGFWAVPPLLEALLSGQNPAERANASLALGTIRDPRTLSFLLRAAERDSHVHVPAFATLMMGKFQDESILPKLAYLARTGKRNIRVAAVLAIAKVGGAAAYDLLVDILNTENQSVVRSAAIFCLGFYRDRALVPGPDGGAAPCDPLLKALRSAKDDEKRAALLALTLIGHRDLKNLYLLFAASDDPDIRRIALLALGRFPDEDVTRILLAQLRNPKVPGKVKMMAAFLLKDRHDPAVLDELLQPNLDQPVKAALTLALSNFEVQQAVDKIVYRLTDHSDQVQSAAAIALSRLTDPKHKELAITMLTKRLQGEGGPLDQDVAHNLRRAREILRTGEAPGSFLYLGNEAFVADLPKDIEERVLDHANHEAQRVLDLLSLTPIKAGRRDDPRFRVNDELSELRDLKDHLERHPYFEPEDIPEPVVSITPRVERGK